MRILFLISGLAIGGAERQLVLLTRGLRERGHDVAVVLSRPGGDFEAELAEAGVLVHKPRRRSALGPIGHALFVHEVVRAFRPQVVHGYLPVGNLMALVGRLFRPRPKIVWGLRASNMDLRNYGFATRLAHRLEALSRPLADLAITNSTAGAQFAEARGFRPARLTVIPNGVSLAQFYPDPERRARARAAWGVDGLAVVGHVGRLDPMKDHATFLRALRGVFAQRRDACAIIVAAGADAQRRQLQGLAEQLELGSRVTILPDTKDMLAIYNAFDTLCLSSAYGEGFPNVLLEAMSCGTPCAVTRVGDAERIVGGTGASAPPGDPEALAAALLDVLKRYVPRDEEKARLVREQVMQFSVEQLSRRTEETLLSLVGASH